MIRLDAIMLCMCSKVAGALWGLHIADAMAMPTHWYYGGLDLHCVDDPLEASLFKQDRRRCRVTTARSLAMCGPQRNCHVRDIVINYI